MVGWSHVDGTVVRWRARAKHPRRRRRRQSAVRSSQPHPCHQPDAGGGSDPLRLRQLRACTKEAGQSRRPGFGPGQDEDGFRFVASPASSRRNDSQRHDTSQPKIASAASHARVAPTAKTAVPSLAAAAARSPGPSSLVAG